MIKTLIFLIVFFFSFTTTASEQAVAKTIDSFHTAASKADGKSYFDLLTKDAIFLGTDATERWSKAQFQAFAKPYFDQGKGWTYTTTSRHIYLSSDGNTAWFDEMLDNASYGECRGSGVLVKTADGWKIAQYHLVIPVPNALAKELVKKALAIKN